MSDNAKRAQEEAGSDPSLSLVKEPPLFQVASSLIWRSTVDTRGIFPEDSQLRVVIDGKPFTLTLAEGWPS